jgi:hypothetical protein
MTMETCAVCDAAQPLEAHHLRGRTFPETLPLCVPCHKTLHRYERKLERFPDYRTDRPACLLAALRALRYDHGERPAD